MWFRGFDLHTICHHLYIMHISSVCISVSLTSTTVKWEVRLGLTWPGPTDPATRRLTHITKGWHPFTHSPTHPADTIFAFSCKNKINELRIYSLAFFNLLTAACDDGGSVGKFYNWILSMCSGSFQPLIIIKVYHYQVNYLRSFTTYHIFVNILIILSGRATGRHDNHSLYEWLHIITCSLYGRPRIIAYNLFPIVTSHQYNL